MYIDTSASTRICLNADTADAVADLNTNSGAIGKITFDSTQQDEYIADNQYVDLAFWNNGVICKGSSQYMSVYKADVADAALKLFVARTLTIGNTGKAFDGSSNVSWTLAEIGAADASHTHNYAGSDSAGGPANSVKDTNMGTDKLDKITFSSSLYNDYVSDWDNGFVNIAFWEDDTGRICKGGSEYLSVNHSTTSDEATKLTAARTLTIGSTGKTFDGSADVSWTLSEIGAAAADHSHSYLPLSGGTITGAITGPTTSCSWINATRWGAFNMATAPGADSAASALSIKTTSGSWGLATLDNTNNLYLVYGTDTNYNAGTNQITKITFGDGGSVYANKVSGAVWNDYAEFRISDCLEPGRVVCENGDDTLSIATKRLQPGASIISDTYGFAIGETDEAKCPIAVSGRVLAYGYEDRDEFKLNIGRPVCAGPNGTVSIMTDDEYKNYGYCAIGTISAVPDYEEWGTGKIKVNNRIWIKVA